MKKPGKGPGGGERVLKTRIKKKSGLKNSSRRWLERHMNDPYVHKAKAAGYRSRAAFKLVEIDERYKLLKPGGHFVAKTFQGGTENALLDLLKRNFQSVHHVKPPASRDESVELYILAKGFKGRAAPEGNEAEA